MLTNRQKYIMILNWLKLKKSEPITPEHFDRKVARHIPDFNVAGPGYGALIKFQVDEVRGYLVRRVEKCKVPLNKWCSGLNKKKVQLRTRAAGVNGTNLYDGEIVEMCAECRKANNGGFKILRRGE